MPRGWGLAEFMILGSSLRLPSYAHPVLLTSNYPDRDHWTAVRFLDEGDPRRLCVRIPPGERATVEYRERQATLLAARPDLKARLIDGEFGTVVQGAQVAVGFKKDLHVARHSLSPQHGGALVIGWDGGFQPSAIVGQRMGDEIHVYASLTKGGVGTLQCIEDVVGPWLREHAPWALRSSPGDRRMIHAIDPSMKTGSQADRTVSPESVIRKRLGGHVVYGAVSWPGRRDPMLTLLGQATLDGGLPRAKLQLDAEGCALLIQALDHRWFYPVNPATGQVSREGPKKPNSPAADLGDAFAYFAGAVTSGRDPEERRRLHQFYSEHPPARPHRVPDARLSVRAQPTGEDVDRKIPVGRRRMTTSEPCTSAAAPAGTAQERATPMSSDARTDETPAPPPVNVAAITEAYGAVQNAVNRIGRPLIELEKHLHDALEAAARQGDASRARADETEARAALAGVKAEMAGAEEERGRVREELAGMLRQQEVTAAELGRVQDAVAAARATLATVEAQRDELSARVAEIHARLGA